MANPYFTAQRGEVYDDKMDAALTQISNEIAAAGTGTAKAMVGTNAERLALTTASIGLRFFETDTKRLYYCTAISPSITWIEGSAWPLGTRHDHASYIALRPSGTGSWATLVTGEAGKLKLVLPYVSHTQADYTTRTGGLRQDGGTTYNVDFDVVSGLGPIGLGALVVDSASIVLAGRAGYSNDLAYWAEVLDAPQGVKRLSGIPAGAAMLAVPASGSPATLHTAAKRARVTAYAGRASGTTDTKFVYTMGETTAGANSLVASLSMMPRATPAVLWQGVLNAGESIKVGAQAASNFWVWGYAQEVEA